MSFHPRNLTGLPIEEALLADLIRDRFDATHPDDSFDDFRRRATFDKHDKGLLKHWLVAAYDKLG